VDRLEEGQNCIRKWLEEILAFGFSLAFGFLVGVLIGIMLMQSICIENGCWWDSMGNECLESGADSIFLAVE
tara:strand:+ start:572 stop:787 length:216 start_codon:yes stop_codon:yes gene_type:complete